MRDSAWGKLREAGVDAALQPLRGRLRALAEAGKGYQRQQELALKIVAVGGLRGDVWAEVERRTEVFAEAQRSSTHVRGNPRTSALESVLRDLQEGRL